MPKQQQTEQQKDFVASIRQAEPYIQAHRETTFVIMFDGETVDEQFDQLVNDLALINTLGIRLVLVHGARPQIENRLKQTQAELRYVNALRVTAEVDAEGIGRVGLV